MKFIIVRFAPGASGKFLSTLLQLSAAVNPWSEPLHSDQNIAWFIEKFTPDFSNWLKYEPEIPYQTGFVSTRFERGDDIDLDHALELLKDDALFQQHWSNDQKICLISNKSSVPAWIINNCYFVNVIVDSGFGRHWIDRCRLHKQFLQQSPDTWIIKQDHPDFCSSARAQLARQFSNPGFFRGTKNEFLKKYIVQDYITNMFTDQNLIVEHASNHNQAEMFVNLSNIVRPSQTVSTLDRICKQLGIEPPDSRLTQALADHYWHIHQGILAERYRHDPGRH